MQFLTFSVFKVSGLEPVLIDCSGLLQKDGDATGCAPWKRINSQVMQIDIRLAHPGTLACIMFPSSFWMEKNKKMTSQRLQCKIAAQNIQS